MSEDRTKGCGCTEHLDRLGLSTGFARRGILAAGVAIAGTAALDPLAALAQTTLTPDAALAELMAGNARFAAGKIASFREDLHLLRTAAVAKQEPFAGILCCADSRVPAELVFDQSLGRLFVARVAGNIATTEMIASLEYGAAVLGTRLIVVLAHQGCGAIKAAVAGLAVPGQISALYAPLQAAVEQGHHDFEVTARLNAIIQAKLLAVSSPVLSDLIKQDKLKVVPAYYALDTGRVALL